MEKQSKADSGCIKRAKKASSEPKKDRSFSENHRSFSANGRYFPANGRRSAANDRYFSGNGRRSAANDLSFPENGRRSSANDRSFLANGRRSAVNDRSLSANGRRFAAEGGSETSGEATEASGALPRRLFPRHRCPPGAACVRHARARRDFRPAPALAVARPLVRAPVAGVADVARPRDAHELGIQPC